jgi:homoaconitate hydratase family protein
MAARTIAQKVLASHACRDDVPDPGEHVTATPDWILCHDISAYSGMERMDQLGFTDVAHPEDIILVFDHYVPSPNESISTQMNEMEQWVDEQGIEHFFGSGNGISHNIMAEEGYSVPGTLVVGADSHTVTHGAFGAFATGIGHTDLGEVLGTGELWLRVPESQKVTVDNTLPDGVAAKDLALALMREFTTRGAIYESVEFHGEGVRDLEMHERHTLSNITVEMGAMAGIVPPDETTEEYLEGRAVREYEPVRPDDDAEYANERTVDAGSLEPLVAKPSAVDKIDTVSNCVGTDVDHVFVGTCNNGSWADIKSFAELVEGESVTRDTDLVVTPGTKETLKKLNTSGLSNSILDAGGMIGTPGCGSCFGAHGGILGEGDTCVGTMNRNFPGRMGPGEIYLASPQTAAAAAIHGEITDPREVS